MAGPKELPPLLKARLAARGILPRPAEPPPDALPPAPPVPLPPAPTQLLLHPAASPPLPPGWYAGWSNYAVPYFFCPGTGERSWTPPGFPPPPRHPAAAGLPDGWDVGIDGRRGGVLYYYCVKTGERKWQRPGGTAAAAPTADGAFTPAPAFTGARPGCVFKMGPHGLGYYADVRPGEAAAAPAAVAAVALPAGVIGPSASAQAAPPPPPAPAAAPPAQCAQQPPPPARRPADVDPMDPSAYSDAPVGGWGSGLDKARGGG